jgi:hypothetical protein
MSLGTWWQLLLCIQDIMLLQPACENVWPGGVNEVVNDADADANVYTIRDRIRVSSCNSSYKRVSVE